TTSVLGFLRVWAVGRLRFLRPRSLRFARESALMDRWERAVLEAAALDGSLACELAEMGNVVKGYGEVRRRLSGGLARFLDEVLPPALARARADETGYAGVTDLARRTRHRMLEDEHGPESSVLEAVAGAWGDARHGRQRH